MDFQVLGLVIGINYAEGGTNVSKLDGCLNDANEMEAFLKKTFPKIQLKKLLEKQAMKENIELELKSLLNKANSSMKSLVFVYYAGHGTRQGDKSGDEIDGTDECLVTYDGRLIVDDWLLENFVSKLKSSVHACFISDCCHSGTIYDLPQHFIFSRSLKKMVSQKTKPLKNQIQAKCLSISGCLDNQYAGEFYLKNKTSRGIFTAALVDIWEQFSIMDSVQSLGKKIQDSMDNVWKTKFGYPVEYFSQFVSISTNLGSITETSVIIPTSIISSLSPVHFSRPSSWANDKPIRMRNVISEETGVKLEAEQKTLQQESSTIAYSLIENKIARGKQAKSSGVSVPTIALLVIGALLLLKRK